MKFARIGLRVREPGVARNIKTGITDMPLERRVCPRAAERRQGYHPLLIPSDHSPSPSQQIRVLQKEARE